MRLRVDVNGKSSNDLSQILKQALLRSFHTEIRKLVGRAIDIELTHMFRYMSSQTLGGSNFAEIKHGWWEDYNPDYKKKKLELAGHLRWFSFGYTHAAYAKSRTKATRNPNTLGKELGQLSQGRILSTLGSTRVTIARDLTHVDLRLAPNIRWRLNYLEDQLWESGLISDKSRDKLVGRNPDRYRPMVGYVFAYFRQVRIPRVVVNTIKQIGR